MPVCRRACTYTPLSADSSLQSVKSGQWLPEGGPMRRSTAAFRWRGAAGARREEGSGLRELRVSVWSSGLGVDGFKKEFRSFGLSVWVWGR